MTGVQTCALPILTTPARCTLTYHIAYLPPQADRDGWGTLVESEVERHLAEACAEDPWLAERPPTVGWTIDVPPAEIGADAPIVGALRAAAADVGRSTAVGGLDNWHDGATFSVCGAAPSVCFGPGDIALAHGADESVPVEELVRCAQVLAVAAMRFCGVAAPA